MAPVHLLAEHHWLLIVISVVNLCLYIYDSSSCNTETYRKIFDTIKEKFLRNELQCISDEVKALFPEDNWGKCTPQSKGMTPIVVYLPVFLQKGCCFRVAGLIYRQPPAPKDGTVYSM